MPVHSEGKEKVIGMPETVKPGGQMAHIRALIQRDRRLGCKACNHRKWAQHIVVAFPHRTVGSHLKELPIDDNHFAVEILKRA
jgi:hypothetical protein